MRPIQPGVPDEDDDKWDLVAFVFDATLFTILGLILTGLLIWGTIETRGGLLIGLMVVAGIALFWSWVYKRKESK